MVVDQPAHGPVGLAQPVAPPLARRQRQRRPLARVDVDRGLRAGRHELVLEREDLEVVGQVAGLAAELPPGAGQRRVARPAEVGGGQGEGDGRGEDVVVAAAERVAEGDEGAGADLQGLFFFFFLNEVEVELGFFVFLSLAFFLSSPSLPLSRLSLILP